LNPNEAVDPEDPKSVKEAEARRSYKKALANQYINEEDKN